MMPTPLTIRVMPAPSVSTIGEHVCDLRHALLRISVSVCCVVNRAGIVAGPDDRENAILCWHHHGRVAHGEEDLLQGVGSREVTQHGIGNQHGMVADLRLAVGIESLFEDADDDERNSFDADGSADGRVGAAVELLREGLDDDGDLFMCQSSWSSKKRPDTTTRLRTIRYCGEMPRSVVALVTPPPMLTLS